MWIQQRFLSASGMICCVLIFLFFVSTGFSQITWQRTYGGTSSEEGYCVDKTTDGGYVVTGYTFSFGNHLQIYVVKTDSLGDTLWTRNFGGAGHERGLCIKQTSDGGYIIVGFTNSFGNGYQIYLIKLNSLGDTLWTRTYGGPDTEIGYSVDETQDRGYIITGGGHFMWAYDPVYLIKTDSMGNIEWNKVYYSESLYTTGRSVQQTTDGGYIVTGSEGDADDIFLMKTDSLGDTLWYKTYGFPYVSVGRYVEQTSDGSYIITGKRSSRAFLLKTDSLGDTTWLRIYMGPNGFLDGYSFSQTTDGGYIMTGIYYDFEGYPDPYEYLFLLKTDSIGDTIWFKAYNPLAPHARAAGYSVKQTFDGGYIVTGLTYAPGKEAEVYLIKTDQNGDVLGLKEDNRIQHSFWILNPIVSPNPFFSFTKVCGYEKERFVLYDVTGRKVGIYQGDKIGLGLPPGVYFLVSEDKSLKPVRIVKIR